MEFSDINWSSSGCAQAVGKKTKKTVAQSQTILTKRRKAFDAALNDFLARTAL
jgi:hypothetical protein